VRKNIWVVDVLVDLANKLFGLDTVRISLGQPVQFANSVHIQATLGLSSGWYWFGLEESGQVILGLVPA